VGRVQRALPDAGYYAVSDSRPSVREHFLVDGGPFGLAHVPGHGHSDSLSFVWRVCGQDVLTDRGIWVYEPSEESLAFKRGLAHNTVTIDGQDQAFLWRFMRWCFLPNVTTHCFEQRGEGYFFDGEHDGYRRLREPVIHRRRISYLPAEAILVEDLLTGEGSHEVAIVYQFGVGMSAELADGTVRFRSDAVSGRLSVICRSQALPCAIEETTVCPDYGVVRKAPRCMFRLSWTPGSPVVESVFTLDGFDHVGADAIRTRVSGPAKPVG
jgi:hypothetical protein